MAMVNGQGVSQVCTGCDKGVHLEGDGGHGVLAGGGKLRAGYVVKDEGFDDRFSGELELVDIEGWTGCQEDSAAGSPPPAGGATLRLV